jgi:hypothetical protein
VAAAVIGCAGAAPEMLVSTDIAEMVIVVVVKAPAGATHQYHMLSHKAVLQLCNAAADVSNRLTPAPVEHLQQHAPEMYRM